MLFERVIEREYLTIRKVELKNYLVSQPLEKGGGEKKNADQEERDEES